MCLLHVFTHFQVATVHIQHGLNWGGRSWRWCPSPASYLCASVAFISVHWSRLCWCERDVPYGLRHLNNWSPVCAVVWAGFAGMALVRFVTGGGFESWKDMHHCQFTLCCYLRLKVRGLSFSARASLPSPRCTVVIEKYLIQTLIPRGVLLLWQAWPCCFWEKYCGVLSQQWEVSDRWVFLFFMCLFFESVILLLGHWNHPGWNCLCNVIYLSFAVRT